MPTPIARPSRPRYELRRALAGAPSIVTQLQFPRHILHGGDYNPEQWPQNVWDDDVRLMNLARWNVATFPVFAWAKIEPVEATFCFDWLDEVVEKLTSGGIGLCLATSTGSVPAWVSQKYPDTLVTEANGVRRRHGHRHLFCPNSPDFRRLSTQLVRKLAERYGDHPNLQIWHVGNEYGRHCFCDICAAQFRRWCRERYGSLAALNERWYTSFWGHTYSDWSQIDPPYTHGESAVHTQRLDYMRFQSQSVLNCYRAEAQVIREFSPRVPITTNLMGAFCPLNYREWGKEMDVISWDCYPQPTDPPAYIAFSHALMRGLKEGQPFLLMEQSPSQAQWHPYNTFKAPGVLRLQSFQALAQGADSVMYFQWRRGRGGQEKLHGAVVEHGGDETNRVFGEVAALGRELESLGDQTIGGRVPARVAVLFDWECWWDTMFSSGPSKDLGYVEEVRRFFVALYELGLPLEIVAPDADLSRFEVIFAPVLTLVKPEVAPAIEARVQEGATFVTTYFSGVVDEDDTIFLQGSPGPFRRVLGLRVEESEALPPPKVNGMRFENPIAGWQPQTDVTADLLCDRVRLEGAEVVARYTSDFYAGEPVITVNSFGQGRAYYLASRPEPATLREMVGAICHEKGLGSPLCNGAAPPDGVEVNVRGELLYLLNHNETPVTLNLEMGTYRDLLLNREFSGALELEPRGVRILEKIGQ